MVEPSAIPYIDNRITVGQMVQMGEIALVAIAFLFRKYIGSEDTAEKTKAHAAMLAQNAETIAKLTNVQESQQGLIVKIDKRVERIETDFYEPRFGSRGRELK